MAHFDRYGWHIFIGVSSWGHHDDYQWALMAISSETATKLVQGGFKTYDELANFEDNQRERFSELKIHALYRTVEYDNREEKIRIIETLFINE